MFGSKKRREEQAAAQAAFVAESAEALTGFQKRLVNIQSVADHGERLLELDKFSADVGQRINAEKNKIVPKTPGMYVGIPSGLLGAAGVITGLLTGTAIIALPAFLVMGCGVGVGIAMDDHATNKPKKLGLYSDAFVEALKELDVKAREEKQTILTGPYEDLSSSAVFDKVVKKYPSIKDAFVEHAVINITGKKPSDESPAPPKHGGQDFTL